ncbi:MAG TPA: hypothetical protein ENK99_05990 [Campylobacterales bacterium]|nr:hypothetical protein [Campylobacterales bacterium]HHD81120.1 hypothetical protein [Campylobacterales bacterium]HHH53601.1 hypothetical protein [Bacteroidota bacterium]
MKTVVEKILNDAKIAYKESIKIENELLEDCLLSIIGNAQSILNEKIESKQKNQSYRNNNQELDEVKKVHRKVPRWLNNPSQYNYKILTTFMTLSNNNTTPISISLLKKHSNIEDDKFISHFNQMKTISERNHAKVFDENYGEVKLWKPIATFIIDLYKKH